MVRAISEGSVMSGDSKRRERKRDDADVERIKAAVDSGRYRLDPDRLANAIMDDVEVRRELTPTPKAPG